MLSNTDISEVMLRAKMALEGMVEQFEKLEASGRDVEGLREKIGALASQHNLCIQLLGVRGMHELEKKAWQADRDELRLMRALNPDIPIEIQKEIDKIERVTVQKKRLGKSIDKFQQKSSKRKGDAADVAGF